jgi:hypothetical protein
MFLFRSGPITFPTTQEKSCAKDVDDGTGRSFRPIAALAAARGDSLAALSRMLGAT